MKRANWTRRLAVLALGGMVASGAAAQVTARQATPEETAKVEKGALAQADLEVTNPMILEVSLAASGARRAVWAVEPKTAWMTRETGAFVCDQARVRHVIVIHGEEKRGKVPLEVSPTLTSEWYRQDVDLTITVESESGKVLGRRVWDDLTLGNNAGPYAGRPRSPKLELELPAEVWRTEFADGKQPKVRILVEIQGETGDEDDD